MARVMSHVPFPQRLRRTRTGAETTVGTCSQEADLSAALVDQQAPETQPFSAVPLRIHTGTPCTGLASAHSPLTSRISRAVGSSPRSQDDGGGIQPPYSPHFQEQRQARDGEAGGKVFSLRSESNELLSPDFLNLLFKISFHRSA